ncbi:MAG: SIR2 family protein [Candidatus Methanoperedens sp.]|nr:SIR2 family protein [Candidatus Methanoperedens sp.]
MKRIEQVIILGAGASKSEGAPLQKELFEEFFKDQSIFEDIKKNDPKTWKNIWNLVEEQERLIKDFFNDFWGIDVIKYNTKIDFPTFEECLGTLDLANLQGQSFKGYDKEIINKTRNALIFIIAHHLDNGKLREVNHRKLIDRLKSKKTLKKTAFISLNYDIIIDNILTDLDIDFHIDYGIDFVNFRRVDDWLPPDPEKSVLLLKLHGSLNWLYCTTCNHIELFPKENCSIKLFFKNHKEICKDCQTPMKFVIIPPTFYKEMSNPFIQQIFLKADEILRQADRICICGYSFPDADIHIKYLLKRAEIFRGETPEIYVMNNHEFKTDTQKQEEELRFIRFFKNKDKIHYYKNKSFQDFVKEGIDIK